MSLLDTEDGSQNTEENRELKIAIPVALALAEELTSVLRDRLSGPYSHQVADGTVALGTAAANIMKMVPPRQRLSITKKFGEMVLEAVLADLDQ